VTSSVRETLKEHEEWQIVDLDLDRRNSVLTLIQAKPKNEKEAHKLRYQVKEAERTLLRENKCLYKKKQGDSKNSTS